MKTRYIALVVILVAVAVGVAYMTRNNEPVVSENNNENQPPKDPSFVLGDVVRADQQKITFISNSTEKVAELGDFTQLVKQEKAADGSMKVVPAQIVDFKAKSKVVVYYNTSSGDVYQAVKVQRID